MYDVVDAAADARAAQERAGVRVRALVDVAELDDARAVFDAVWPDPHGGTQVTPDLLKAMAYAGCYVSAAYRDDRPVGASYALVGRTRTADGWRVYLHSHMAAVLAEHRDRHIGAALKLHQRAWALARDVDTIGWTFDPLMRRNVRLNILKLGVEVDGFEVDFYGSLDDGINTDDPTDRLFAWWRLDSDRVDRAVHGGLAPLDVGVLLGDGRDVRVLALPADIAAIRASDPDAARRWRLDVRAALLAAFAAGYHVVGVDETGDLVLERTT